MGVPRADGEHVVFQLADEFLQRGVEGVNLLILHFGAGVGWLFHHNV